MSNSESKPLERAAPERRPVVAVLEPDRPLRALLREWLELAGYDYVDGRTAGALAAVLATGDVILIDVRAPLRSARQALAAVAAEAPHASIVATSADALASGSLAAEAVARELGVAAVLVKPFDRNALMRALEHARRQA